MGRLPATRERGAAHQDGGNRPAPPPLPHRAVRPIWPVPHPRALLFEPAPGERLPGWRRRPGCGPRPHHPRLRRPRPELRRGSGPMPGICAGTSAGGMPQLAFDVTLFASGCGHHVGVEPGRHRGTAPLRHVHGRTARSRHSCAPSAAPPAGRTEGGAERAGQTPDHCGEHRLADRVVAGQRRLMSAERHRPVIPRIAFGRGGSRAPGSVCAAARTRPEPRSYSVPRLRAGSARTAGLPARAAREGLCGTALAPRRAAQLPAPPPSANRVKADRRAHARSPSIRHKNDRKDRIR